MKKTALLLMALLLLLAVSCSSDPYAASRKYHIISMGDDFSNKFSTYQRGRLYATVKDAVQVGRAFKSLTGDALEDIHYLLGYDGQTLENLGFTEPYESPTFENFCTAVSEIRENASEEDITIVFFSTHGNSDDAEVPYGKELTGTAVVFTADSGTDSHYVSLDDIYEKLEQIPGTKLVLGDFCFSGGLIEYNNITADDSLFKDTDLKEIFFSSSINVKHPSVFVISASSYFEESYERYQHDHGVFTYCLLKALGWDDSNPASPVQGKVLASDGNLVTVSSLYKWIYKNGGVHRGSLGLQRPVATSTSADLVIMKLDTFSLIY